MRCWSWIASLLVLSTACGESEDGGLTARELEQHGCELRTEGPFRGPIQAAATAAAAPLVDLREASTEISVPTGGGMLRFELTEGDSLDHLILVDRPVLVEVRDQFDNLISPLHPHTGLDQCPTLITRFDVFLMQTGPYVLHVPASGAGTLNLAMYGVEGVPDFY